MPPLRRPPAALATCCLLLLATACGSGAGGSGSPPGPTAAAIDETSQQQLALAAVEGFLAATLMPAEEDLDVLIPVSFETSSNALVRASPEPAIPRGGARSEECIVGGRVRFRDFREEDGFLTGRVLFLACDDGDLYLDGVVHVAVDVETAAARFRYLDFRMGFDAEASLTFVRLELRCTSVFELAEAECRTVEPPILGFTGLDGRRYEIDLRDAELTCAGGACSVAGARVTDPDHGQLDVDGQGVRFDCPGSFRPSTGHMQLYGAHGTRAELSFPSCETVEVCREPLAARGAGTPPAPDCGVFAWQDARPR